jgi:GAF domain-containing protein
MANLSPLSLWEFPFQLQLHLKPFIDYWRALAVSPNSPISDETVAKIEQILKKNPELFEPTIDIRIFEPHQEFLNLLFAQAIPVEGFSNSIEAVTAPFAPYPPIKATRAYQNIVNPSDGKFELLDISFSGIYVDLRVLYAYKFILKKFYNFDLNVDQPVLTALSNAQTGLSRYFKLLGSPQFVDCILLAPLPEIDEESLQDLLDRDYDPVLWQKFLPPENFLFRGVTFVTLMDVTIEQAVARTQRYLLNSPDEGENNWFDNIRKEVQCLFRLQGLRLGIATIQRNGELNFNSKNPLWNSLLLRELFDDPRSLVEGSIYGEIMSTGQTIIIEDLNKCNNPNHPVEQAILKAGYNNMLCTPIHYDGQLIGIMELATPYAGQVNGLSLFKINQVKPIFAVAQKRLLEEFENRVEAIMLQQFTSIHPAIQWRFRDAAIHYLENKSNGLTGQEIVFENVFPFYGSLDIRDSSKKRSKAIGRDLMHNLDAAHGVLREGYESLSFEILGELINDVEKCRDKIRESFSSGDEASVTRFIRTEINPVITHLYQQYPQLIHSNPEYHETITSATGICTQYRLGYEAALGLVNNCIVNCLEAEEADLQRLYPCYFEKYRTDGVEYNIYAGPSIARGRDLDTLYLDNLRLRQLLWTWKIIQEVDKLQPQLQRLIDNSVDQSMNGDSDQVVENKIEVAPLILAYTTPITLKFRPDEKRIDVDGSYNVRYEILKKRIDKATILGRPDRLTQPGHISVVYTQDHEIAVYEKHLKYLVNKGYINKEWEYLDLEPMQGVEGLRAIRVKVI